MTGGMHQGLGLEVPAGWQLREEYGTRRFLCRARVARPDGVEIDWSTRRHRKGLAPAAGQEQPGRRRRDLIAQASPSSIWMGALFMVGSALFALGSMPLFFEHVDARLVTCVFFAGSIFFTVAAYLQFRECIDAPLTVDPSGRRPRGPRSLVGWRPRSLGWWSTAVQLVGTVLFNVSTYSATRDAFSVQQERELIWAPDALGSGCFLIASWLAFIEISPRPLHPPRGDVGWRVAILNLAGSVAFGCAAIGARIVATGEPANIRLVNVATFIGALCFFIGAALLPVESATHVGGDTDLPEGRADPRA